MQANNHIPHNVYFIGIGGIGMSALAFYFAANGHKVAGYDRTPSAITKSLETQGVQVVFKDTVAAIPEGFDNPENTLIVYTPAVPVHHLQLVRFRESASPRVFRVLKRAEVLAMIANTSTCLAVAGTHGKTTTSSILGHLLAETGVKVTAFVGGVMNNYNSNLILKGTDVVVVEADEFDRSFLRLHPTMACVTSMDADHLDIYDNADDLVQTFKDFTQQVSGDVFAHTTLPVGTVSVGIEDAAAYSAQNISIKNGVYVFDLKHPNGVLQNVQFSLPGRHNLMNAITALGMSIQYGVPTDRLSQALKSYAGVNRRFTFRIKEENRVLIDDYAHHPTEIAAVHQSVRELFPDENVLAIFQPHLFSRTQDFMSDFASELARFDTIVLLDIYPARELPIDGVTSAVLLDKIVHNDKQLVEKGQLLSIVENTSAKIIVMMGAGDIGVEILNITKALSNED